MEEKLSRLQAERVAALDASKFALERADQKVSQQREDAQNAQSRAFQQQQLAQNQSQFGASQAFNQQQFEEDKRRYGLEYALKQRELAQKASTTSGGMGGGGTGANDAVIAAMIANPALFDSLTPTMKAAYLPALTAAGFTGETKGSPYQAELATQGRQAISGLIGIAEKNPGIFGRTAALPLPDYLRSDDFRNYTSQLDFLKGNIIPAALTAMREASKTGGALGQVSDREGAWLGSSLGALSMTQNPSVVIEQLKLIDASFKRWQTAVAASGGTDYQSYLNAIGQ